MTQNTLKKIALLFILAMIFEGCRSVADIPVEFPTPPGPEPAKPAPKLEFKRDAELERQFAKIAEEAKGKVGVAAVVLETGEAAFLNADEHYPMQSVYKLPIAMAMMEEIRLGRHELDEEIGVTKNDMVRAGMASPLRDKNPDGGEVTIRELIRFALVESDGTASDVLMRVLGDASIVQGYLSQIGINDMKVVNTEKEIGRDWQTQYQNWATPNAAVELLRWLWMTQRAEVSNREDPEDYKKNCLTGYNLIWCDMDNSVTGPNRLKKVASGIKLKDGPPRIAHKTGTGGTQNGITSATNDIGLISRGGDAIAIAVFVSDSPADEKTREAVIAKIAKAVYDRLTTPQLTTALGKPHVATCWTTMSKVDRSICRLVLGGDLQTIESDYGKPIELSYVKRDLNSDGVKEMIIWESSWSGTSGGSFFLFSQERKGYRKLFETDMTWSPIIHLQTKHRGWSDVAYHVRGGGVDPVFVTVQFNGKRYVAGPAQEDPPDGEIVIGKNWVHGYFGPMTVN